MNNKPFWNCTTILGLVLIDVLCGYFNFIGGMMLTTLMLALYLCFMIPDIFRDHKDDDINRDEVNNSRKSNY
jgi:hypothetical protein